ncbi:MAG: LptF/LptG family permease, partial [Gammaproteobacteria bacterium]
SDERSKVKPTLDLVRDPNERNLAELLWRIGLPVSAFLMALLAIPLSAMNPRMGRSVNLVAALLLYVLYNNLLSVVQAWVAQGRIPFALGVWVVHAVLAALIGWLFWRRVRLPGPGWLARLRLGSAAA